MKKLVFLLLLLGASAAGGFGQDKTKRTPPNGKQIFEGYHNDYLENVIIPLRDTVIIRGEEIEIGAWLSENWDYKSVEIVGFGKSKEKDYKKGIYLKKLKPQQTTTYELISCDQRGVKHKMKRTVYVAKNEEEKKQFEKLARQKEKEEKERRRARVEGKTTVIKDLSKFKHLF